MTNDVQCGFAPCRCAAGHPQAPRLIAVTGGPGAGKTAALELAKIVLCAHVAFVPESASIIFGGGFWRRDSVASREAAQTVIFNCQRQLEAMVICDRVAPVALCDRGTIDGAAYWPDGDLYWAAMGTTRAAELDRYHTVIHLRTPSADHGYNHQNPERVESARQAVWLDERILSAWDGHPRRVMIEASTDFTTKARETLVAIMEALPAGLHMNGAS